jgi:hypothetical protein
MTDDQIIMNEALRRWINEKQCKSVKKDSILNKNSEKKLKKKCEICGKKTAVAVCIKCERSVCKSCHFKIIGVCKKCIPQDIAKKWEGSGPDWEKELGVEWVG